MHSYELVKLHKAQNTTFFFFFFLQCELDGWIVYDVSLAILRLLLRFAIKLTFMVPCDNFFFYYWVDSLCFIHAFMHPWRWKAITVAILDFQFISLLDKISACPLFCRYILQKLMTLPSASAGQPPSCIIFCALSSPLGLHTKHFKTALHELTCAYHYTPPPPHHQQTVSDTRGLRVVW